ncbi:MAG: limonene-1,2-epoxide hydrolase family protein [Acidimicrobiales bacterium]
MSATDAPIDVVRSFCSAWGTKDLDAIVAFFTPDAVYHNIPLAPVVGPEQIKATIEGFSGGVESIEFRVDAIAADGGTVLTERHDIFTFANGLIDLPVMGTFEVVDGKIAAWRDYFDMNQFLSQMPQG